MLENRKAKNLTVMPLLFSDNKFEKKTKKIELYYKKILLNILKIAKEMKMNNSFQICVLFNYLLEVGYLCSDNKNKFGRNDIPYFGRNSYLSQIYITPYIISLGQGVCQNYATMLNDLLMLKGYKSAVLCCKSEKESLTFEELVQFDKNIADTMYKEGEMTGHANVLICEKGYLYVYDPTYETMGTLINRKKINCEDYSDGTIEYKASFLGVKNLKSLYPLLKLYKVKEKEVPYTKEMIEIEYDKISEFISTSKFKNLELYILKIKKYSALMNQEMEKLFIKEEQKQLKKKR